MDGDLRIDLSDGMLCYARFRHLLGIMKQNFSFAMLKNVRILQALWRAVQILHKGV
jgi:hypothetical protein